MDREAQIKSVALFFFFSLLDEKAAFQATTKTLGQSFRRQRRKDDDESDAPSRLVHLTQKNWEKWNNKKKAGQSLITYEAGWLLKPDIDLGPWKEFRKEADPDEFLAVIWSHILKFSDQHISEGLGVTIGTVRHRVGRGLRHLGSLKAAG